MPLALDIEARKCRGEILIPVLPPYARYGAEGFLKLFRGIWHVNGFGPMPAVDQAGAPMRFAQDLRIPADYKPALHLEGLIEPTSPEEQAADKQSREGKPNPYLGLSPDWANSVYYATAQERHVLRAEGEPVIEVAVAHIAIDHRNGVTHGLATPILTASQAVVDRSYLPTAAEAAAHSIPSREVSFSDGHFMDAFYLARTRELFTETVELFNYRRS